MFSPAVSHFVIIILYASLADTASAIEKRLDNGLGLTPPMGWNSYNHYSCSPNESIIHSNAQAVKNLGLLDLGYEYVTVDCGWTLPNRTSNGTLAWNPERFPSGYPALSDFIHGLGLKFGVYSDGGVQMCMTGEPAQAGSLGYEQVDADTFTSWGADLLKYDNCFSDAATNYPNTNYNPSVSPKDHFVTMSKAIASSSRDILFQVCDWGVDFPSAWAPAIGHSWRVTNDIIPSWKTIPRILNQVVSQTDFAGPGRWLDLDMLEVGNDVFTIPEEQTHFSLWAIIKSPLVIGGALKDAMRSISSESLAILKNSDVIGYNQDSMGVAASLRRRWTEDKYEIWAGPLSGNRTVVALINYANVARELTLDLPDLGFQSAGALKNTWTGKSSSKILTSYSAMVEAKGTMLLELAETISAGQYNKAFATTSGNTTIFSSIYGSTSSSEYTATLEFASNASATNAIEVISSAGSIFTSYQLSGSSLTIPVSLLARNNNTLKITSTIPILSLSIAQPSSTFYSAAKFITEGDAAHTPCSAGLCQPVGAKVSNISPKGSASFSISSPSSASSMNSPVSKFANIYFINNDVAMSTSWTTGTNTRNMTLTVNGVTTRIETPLSGRSSELYSPMLGWGDTGLFRVLLPGFKEGGAMNSIQVGNSGGEDDLVAWAPDFVGLEIFW